ncbi:unnamed protein product, partial [Prorocentrum cordatum]
MAAVAVEWLVGRAFPQEADDPRWAATDPRKRAQVANVRDRTETHPNPKSEIDYSDVPGFSTSDLIQIEKQSRSVVRKRNNQATMATTTTTAKGKTRKDTIPYLSTAVNLVGAFVSWGTLGYWGGASWASYVIGKRLKIWAASRAVYSTAQEVVEVTEYVNERWDEVAECFAELDLEFMPLIACGLFVIGSIGRVWRSRRQARRSIVGGDSDSDQSEKEFGRAVTVVGGGVQMQDSLGSPVQSQPDLAREIAQLKQVPRYDSPRTATATSSSSAGGAVPLGSPRGSSELSGGISSLLDRLKEREGIARTDVATRGSRDTDLLGALLHAGPARLSSAAGSGGASKVLGLIQVIEQETRGPRSELPDHLHKHRDIDGWILGGAKARIAAPRLAQLYKNGKAAQESVGGGAEFLLPAMILDKMITNQKEDIINSAACEILRRRMRGLQLAFQSTHRQADWEQSRGQQGSKWKSKVQRELCDQCDARALDENELTMPGVDEEARPRLEKAPFNKYLSKVQDGPREG